MATVINNREPSDRTIVQSDSSGWVFALLLLLLLIGGAAYWTMRHRGYGQFGPTPAAFAGRCGSAAPATSPWRD